MESIVETQYKKAFDYDYCDVFCSNVIDLNNDISSTDLAKQFFLSAPKWVSWLFAFRNKIAAVFGLKTSKNVQNKEQFINESEFNVGEQMGLFKVFYKTDKEIIMGENDTHLDFSVSLLIEDNLNNTKTKKVSMKTAVVFHNTFGKCYFYIVKPFHQKIAKTILKTMIKNLENK